MSALFSIIIGGPFANHLFVGPGSDKRDTLEGADGFDVARLDDSASVKDQIVNVELLV